MYKDKDKQREANRKAQAKFKAKGITQGITNEGITEQGITDIQAGIDRRLLVFKQTGKVAQAEIDALPADVKAAIAREPEDEHQVRTERAVRYQRLFSEQTAGTTTNTG